MKSAIIILLLLPFFCLGQSVDELTRDTTGWIYVTTSADKNANYFVYKQNYEIKDQEVTRWVRIDYKQKIINGVLQLYPSTKELFKFDCSKNKFKLISFYTYNNKGKIIDKVITPPSSSRFFDVPPNSIIQSVCEFVCEETDSDVMTKKEIENEVEKAFSNLKKEFNFLDSTKNYKGVVFNKEFTTVNDILQIKTLTIDSSRNGYKFGLIGNEEFCNIDTLYFIGFAHFRNNKLSQLSLESFNQYRFVASYFVKKYGIPDEYNETSIIWKGKNLQMIVIDNSKKKDNNSLLGEATVIISLY